MLLGGDLGAENLLGGRSVAQKSIENGEYDLVFELFDEMGEDF